MNIKAYLSLVLILHLVVVAHTFIIDTKQGQRKCFKAQQSPDKTLQVKFGFPRRQQLNCEVNFSVDLIENQQSRTSIYRETHRCHEMHPGQPVVVKHTSESAELDGSYEICFEVLANNNDQLLVEVFIGEKLNPLLYGDGDDVLPLIQSQQLIDLDLKVQSIRKSLGWSRKLLTESKELGDRLQAGLGQLNQFSVNATLFQIAFLVIYGIAWIMFMKQQKVN